MRSSCLPFAAALVATVSLPLGACHVPAQAEIPRAQRTTPRTAQEAYFSLEASILSASSVNLDCHVTADGLFSLAFDGSFRAGSSAGDVFFDFQGQIDGAPKHAILRATATGIAGGSREAAFSVPAKPLALRYGALLVVTRLGVMHPVTELADDKPPSWTDGAELSAYGSAADRDIRLSQFSWIEEGRALRYRIDVRGGSPADTTLWLDAGGLPTRRAMTVHFARGDLHVVETYSRFFVMPTLVEPTAARNGTLDKGA